MDCNPPPAAESQSSKLSIFLMTFNLADSKVKSSDFSFIPPGFDLYVLGFEEVGSFLPLIGSRNHKRLSEALNLRFSPDYKVIIDEAMLAIKLFIAVKSSIAIPFELSKLETIPTGADGAYGNKGAIAASIKFGPTQMLFVVAHFAANENEVEARNRNFSDIMGRLRISFQADPIASHSFTFFMGDLNYRLKAPYSQIKALSTAGKYTDLLQFDQLTQEKRALRVFNGFYEEEPDFPPTYRFDKGSIIYDTSSKSRVPSYTDRILVCASNRRNFHVAEYGANMDILISDHRPVFMKADVNLSVSLAQTQLGNPKSVCCSVS